MNKRQIEALKAQMSNEGDVLKEIEKQYKQAIKDIDERILILSQGEETQSKIYQIEYQKTLKKQVQAIVDKLQADQYTTIEQFLHDSYKAGYVGTMYAVAGDIGTPIISPINQAAVTRAVITDSKISESLYNALGVDCKKLKKRISSEISRGIATGISYDEMARNIQLTAQAPFNRTKTIVRTEAHRIYEASSEDARQQAKASGAKIVKQWDATLDGKTRDSHRQLDGTVVEADDYFTLGNKKAKYPGDFGDPAEDCNCRCVALTRAKWALNQDELDTMKQRAEYFGLDKTDSLNDFKKKYLKAAETLKSKAESDIIKKGNTEVRKWYLERVSHIPDEIDSSLPMAEKAKKAFEARNNIRTEARNMMADETTRAKLDQERPNMSFEELVKSKMQRKGMTREEAIADIYKTATKTNTSVNKALGLEE